MQSERQSGPVETEAGRSAIFGLGVFGIVGCVASLLALCCCEVKSESALRVARVTLVAAPVWIAVLLVVGAVERSRRGTWRPLVGAGLLALVPLIWWMILFPSYRVWLIEIAECRKMAIKSEGMQWEGEQSLQKVQATPAADSG